MAVLEPNVATHRDPPLQMRTDMLLVKPAGN